MSACRTTCGPLRRLSLWVGGRREGRGDDPASDRLDTSPLVRSLAAARNHDVAALQKEVRRALGELHRELAEVREQTSAPRPTSSPSPAERRIHAEQSAAASAAQARIRSVQREIDSVNEEFDSAVQARDTLCQREIELWAVAFRRVRQRRSRVPLGPTPVLPTTASMRSKSTATTIHRSTP